MMPNPFELTKITTSNLFTLAQIIAVLSGFFFAWKSLKAAQSNLVTANNSLNTAGQSLKTASNNLLLATQNAQAQIVNQIIVQGRDLQFKYMDIVLENKPDDKKSLLAGTIIGYYSACFELRQVLTLPPGIGKLLDDELSHLMLQPVLTDKWAEINRFHSPAFVQHVNGLMTTPKP